jgi:hypothetical protein
VRFIEVTFIIGKRLYLYPKEEVFVSGKFIFIAALVVLAGGAAFFVPAAPASAPQFETRQDPAQKEIQDRMMREANKKRQKDIRDDTDKLFQLATELKAAVDKTNENLLSIDVVRKAEEVEKLAKKVKEKMKDAIGPPVKDPVRTLPTPTFPH